METQDKIHDAHQDNDGIQEYDNPLPNWFVNLFFGCILFAVIYICYYTGYSYAISKVSGKGQNLSQSGADYMAAVKIQEKAMGLVHPEAMSGNDLQSFLKNPNSISGGALVYKTNCIACHGDEGQGIVGPNLTDDYWIHGGKPQSILESIEHGYPTKGMPAWKPVLGQEKVRLAAAYVISLHGHTVANPKAPQGNKEP